MTKEDNIHDPDSCWNKAALDEPIFVLRAHDVLAPCIINQWAGLFKFQHLQHGTWNEQAKAKYKAALQVAEEMGRWPDVKVPD